MPPGVLYALFAYALYSCCDAIIKGLGHGLSIYEIALFTTMFSLVPVIATTPKGESWRSFWRFKNPWLVHLRCLTGTIGNICIIYAFVSIPLAEAYSLAFLAPIFVVLLSVIVLKETVVWQRWLFLGASFLGVLLVVRPGFRELDPGHITAIIAAAMGAVTTVVLRRVASQEQRIGLIGMASVYIVVFNLAMMLWSGSVTVPTPTELMWLVTIGALGGTGNILFIAATRSAQASQIAPGQYTQIAWAITFGAVFYREYPDALAYAGLVVVAVAGILNVLAGETRIHARPAQQGSEGPALIAEGGDGAVEAVLEAPVAGAIEATSKAG